MTQMTHIDPAPMGEMNTTPLIDVMLVLLIMIIMTMPMQSHAVKLDLPTAKPSIPINDIKNKLVITSTDALLWNARPVSRAEVRQALFEIGQMPNQPELQLQPEASARYALVDEILADTKRAQVSRMGFVGNEHYKTF